MFIKKINDIPQVDERDYEGSHLKGVIDDYKKNPYEYSCCKRYSHIRGSDTAKYGCIHFYPNVSGIGWLSFYYFCNFIYFGHVFFIMYEYWEKRVDKYTEKL